MKNQAFTLIELLVVVLIIGILAAIAVPQYQKAVAKSELAQIISVVKSLKQAQEVYFLTNGKYAANINLLDVSVNDPKVSCFVVAGTYNYIQCYNRNFALVSYVDRTYTECATKTQDINSALAYACRDFTQSSTSSLLDLGVCNTFIKPCAATTSTKNIF